MPESTTSPSCPFKRKAALARARLAKYRERQLKRREMLLKYVVGKDFSNMAPSADGFDECLRQQAMSKAIDDFLGNSASPLHNYDVAAAKKAVIM